MNTTDFALLPIGTQLALVGLVGGLIQLIAYLIATRGPQALRDFRDEARDWLPAEPTELALPPPDAPNEETDKRVLDGLARFNDRQRRDVEERQRHDTLLRNIRPVDPRIEELVRENFARIRQLRPDTPRGQLTHAAPRTRTVEVEVR